MIAKIWISAPHEIDGYYVELLSTYRRLKNVIEDERWFPTVQECKDWAESKGATRIDEV